MDWTGRQSWEFDVSCSENTDTDVVIEDKVAAAAFRRLIAHLRYRSDAENIDLMGLAGFCRNCLADWVSEASQGELDRNAARTAIYGMPYDVWKAAHSTVATPEQLSRMKESIERNA